ncbi:putative RNA recognition motif domain, nucleotide-binding alpha-beta plait domain superfamily [Helianthus annuus]|nr:putative RNA recognition motif domain, nucleotide-binding alpha-beta plait domain superfamily [Helianthus annuus]
MGGRSYSPSPPRGGRYARRGRSPSPRGRYGGGSSRGKDLPTSLLVRNLRLDCRPEDLRRPFGEFGPLKDIYLPRDYYSGEPRGFGFVQFVDPADAAEAKYQMDGQVFQGRELTVVFAEENRKKPADMRSRERRGGSRYSDRRRSPPRRHSPPPRYARSRSRSREYSPPPKRRHQSRSVSPRGKRYSRERSYSRSPVRARSPPYNGGSRSPSRSPIRDRSPAPYNNGSRSPSRSPEREEQSPTGRSPIRSPSRSRSRSRSPDPREYARAKPKRDASLSP